ncbi:MAG: hypothetical protein ABI726_07250 [bacterium]
MIRRWWRRRAESSPRYDPGRERRAERKARELLRSIVSADEYEMYAELGFISVEGGEQGSGYAYLLYPHRPIVAYAIAGGELLNEYCVAFHDDSEPALGSRLPDADDVLAKWMSLRGGERNLIARANMHLPGRQLDPQQVRRDLRSLLIWRSARAGAGA